MRFFIFLIALVFQTLTSKAADTGFVYTGLLKTNSGPNITPPPLVPAQGSYDFEFRLFDGTGLTNLTNQVGLTLNKTNLSVSNGVFQTRLEFGDVAYGKAGYLEIAVRPTSVLPQSLPFEKLSPLQAIPTVALAAWAKRGGTETWRTTFRVSDEFGPTLQAFNGIIYPLEGGASFDVTDPSSFLPLAIVNFSPANKRKIIDSVSFLLTSYQSYNGFVANLEAVVRKFDGTPILTNSILPVVLTTNFVGRWISIPLTNDASGLIVQPGEILSLDIRYVSGSNNSYCRGRIFGEATVHDPD